MLNIGNGDSGGNAQHILGDFQGDRYDAVPVTADDVARPNQDPATSHGNVDVHQLDSPGNNRPPEPPHATVPRYLPQMHPFRNLRPTVFCNTANCRWITHPIQGG